MEGGAGGALVGSREMDVAMRLGFLLSVFVSVISVPSLLQAFLRFFPSSSFPFSFISLSWPFLLFPVSFLIFLKFYLLVFVFLSVLASCHAMSRLLLSTFFSPFDTLYSYSLQALVGPRLMLFPPFHWHRSFC